ncbi:glycosyltransferase family 4 protein [Kallotenue papyrolyticum]|uniref:glycosyltransferase family 4 protein n=1 Tax=Kallotenue papyrolyticum TaxID=1325125 RepID=UPI0004785A4F|nr:glycosyltransferase family 1 protein [Kallotenue papyrolyticum]
MHIAVNAHLLSSQAGYRQAGVSGYIQQLLRHSWAVAPAERWTIYAPPGVTRELIGAPPNVRLRVSRLPTTQPLARILWEQALAPGRLLLDRPQVLLCPLNVVPLLAPCRSVVTIHDLAFLRFRLHTPAKRLYLAAFTRLSVRRAAHVITVSEFTRREVLELLHLPPERVTAIPNGCDARFRPLDPSAVEAFRVRNNLPARFLLFVGTLEPRKNVPTLLRAYARVREHLNLPLLIGGGKGWLYDEIFALTRQLGLEREVRFLGFLEADELPLWYAAATAFVYPSLYEGFGFPPLEAMATGTPVVTSNTASLPEVVGDAALTVPPTDEAALAEALVRVVTDDDLRADLRRRGPQRARQFRWPATAAATIELLRRVAAA